MTRYLALLVIPTVLATSGLADEVSLDGQRFQLPDGFTIERVAGPPLVDRPICADFDELGHLYVADSSGSNDPVEQQVIDRTHRIVRLQDADGDGRFDRSTVFADNMMFPEGCTWLDGSLYVAAPPSIWKLTDTDGDGVADLREEWFQGKTLTHCANDLHGPYVGPDGWLYWAKGAFAEQEYERPGREPFVTKSAHIFRCLPDAPRDPKTGSVLTSAIEPVMTGGMDNPVEVAFSPGGERFFTTTFLVHPGGGLRDGMIHAIYGGVYGKSKEDLANHPRTGDLMPVLVHMGAAAACGLTRYESTVLGDDYRDNLFACQFNMRKVSRHVLVPEGASFAAKDIDFLVSDSYDFHPTDVLEDADGTLLVIDTGGWYKLCCPTSQLAKPDILGGIYRIARKGPVPRVEDPRGEELNWLKLSADQLVSLLADPRPAVRRRAVQQCAALSRSGPNASHSTMLLNRLRELVTSGDRQSQLARLNAVWALTRIDDPPARAAVRQALADPDETVRQAALHSISVWRDADAFKALIGMLKSQSDHNRRAASEALGRIGNADAVPSLLAAAATAEDRALEHSLTFALIEIAVERPTRAGLTAENPRTRRAALIALDQMHGSQLGADEVIPLFSSKERLLRDAAGWIVAHHLDWAPQMATYFDGELRRLSDHASSETQAPLQAHLTGFAGTAAVGELLGKGLADTAMSPSAKSVILGAMSQSGLKTMPPNWTSAITQVLRHGTPELRAEAVAVLQRVPAVGGEEFSAELLRLGRDRQVPAELRLEALAALPGGLKSIDPGLFTMLEESIHGEQPIPVRAAAVKVLTGAKLESQQLTRLAGELDGVSPLDIEPLLKAFERSKQAAVGQALLRGLTNSPARTALREETLRPLISRYPENVRHEAEQLYALLRTDRAEQFERLEQLLADLPEGDIRRGQDVFRSAKAACSACHAVGYLGGRVGPDLTRIGKVRNRKDLLESIVFPSASLVRSYEPVTIATTDGRVHNGLVISESATELVLATGPDKQVRLSPEEIEARRPSDVSVMPAGLDKQITLQELADLVTFLQSRL